MCGAGVPPAALDPAPRGNSRRRRRDAGETNARLWHTVAVSRIIFPAALFALCALISPVAVLGRPGAAPAKQAPPTEKSAKLPRPVRLGRDLKFERDRASGELNAVTADTPAPETSGAIRSRVTLVEVPCTVTSPDGAQVRGLTQKDFRLLEDGAAQEIAS